MAEKPTRSEAAIAYLVIAASLVGGSVFGLVLASRELAVEPAGVPQEIARAMRFVSGVSLFLAMQWFAWIRRLLPGASQVGWALCLLAMGLRLAADPFEEGLPLLYSVLSLFLSLPIVLIAVGYSLYMAMGGELASRFTSAAKELGLPSVKRRLFRLPSAIGEVDGVRLRIASGEEGRSVVEVECPHAPRDLVLERESRSVGHAVFAEQVRTGDVEFDDEVFVRGDENAALGALDPETRAAVRAATREGATFRDGVYRATLDRRADARDIARVARRLVTAANTLRAASDPLTGLKSRARDSDPLVRARAVSILRASFAGQAEDAIAFASKDPDARVRAAAEGSTAQGGELSVASPDGGAVSLARPAGALSLEKKQKT